MSRAPETVQRHGRQAQREGVREDSFTIQTLRSESSRKVQRQERIDSGDTGTEGMSKGNGYP